MSVVEMSPRFNLEKDFALMSAVNAQLGFEESTRTLNDINNMFGEHADLFIDRAKQGHNDRLVVVRAIGGAAGVGVNTFINRSDPNAFKDGYIWHPLWGNGSEIANHYGDKASVHDNGELEGMYDIAILLGDKIDTSTGKEAFDKGLVHTNKTVDQQREALRLEKEQFAKHGLTVVGATVGAMIVDSVGRRIQSESQRSGFTRLTQYDNVEVPGLGLRVPSVNARGSRLCFAGSDVGYSWGGNGVRRLVRVPK